MRDLLHFGDADKTPWEGRFTRGNSPLSLALCGLFLFSNILQPAKSTLEVFEDEIDDVFFLDGGKEDEVL